METIAARPYRFNSTLASAALALAAAACNGNSGAATATSPAPLEYPLRPSAAVVNDVRSSVPGLTPTQTAQGMGAMLSKRVDRRTGAPIRPASLIASASSLT